MAVTLTTPNTILGTLQPKGDAARLATNLVTVVLGTALIALAAKINVPTWPIAVTLQSFAVAALAATFGARIGTATVALYLLEGLAGLPVFATGGGAAYLIGPSGGFLLGFLPMAYIIGRATDAGLSKNVFKLFGAMLVADAVLFVFGFVWLLAMAGQASWVDQSNVVASAFARAVQPFVVWDIVKMAFAAVSVTGLFSLLQRKA